MLDFLGLPTPHSESDLQQGLVNGLRKFLTELGRDFCFIGEQYQLQVGTKIESGKDVMESAIARRNRELNKITETPIDRKSGMLRSPVAGIRRDRKR